MLLHFARPVEDVSLFFVCHFEIVWIVFFRERERIEKSCWTSIENQVKFSHFESKRLTACVFCSAADEIFHHYQLNYSSLIEWWMVDDDQPVLHRPPLEEQRCCTDTGSSTFSSVSYWSFYQSDDDDQLLCLNPYSISFWISSRRVFLKLPLKTKNKKSWKIPKDFVGNRADLHIRVCWHIVCGFGGCQIASRDKVIRDKDMQVHVRWIDTKIRRRKVRNWSMNLCHATVVATEEIPISLSLSLFLAANNTFSDRSSRLRRSWKKGKPTNHAHPMLGRRPSATVDR